jgi:hypothetical protein
MDAETLTTVQANAMVRKQQARLDGPSVLLTHRGTYTYDPAACVYVRTEDRPPGTGEPRPEPEPEPEPELEWLQMLRRLKGVLGSAGMLGLLGAMLWWWSTYSPILALLEAFNRALPAEQQTFVMGPVLTCLWAKTAYCLEADSWLQLTRTIYSPVVFWGALACLLGSGLLAWTLPRPPHAGRPPWTRSLLS